jgi:putative two-component system response regulator
MVCQKEKILIVDDEAPIRRLLNGKLNKEGYSCDEADSVDHALTKLEGNLSELVVSDIRMPGKTGLDLLIEVKARYPDTAMIMATGVVEIAIAIESLKHGADDYICKPFDLEQVVTSVRRSLEKRRLQISLKEYQRELESKIALQTAKIGELSLAGIEALVNALEAKDRYTAGHSRRVTDISEKIGRQLGLSENEMEDLRRGSILHDIGKIAVSELIQNKPGNLTEEEYEHMMIHAQVGAGIIRPVANQKVVDMVQHHHDHFNGQGLHQSVSGKNIPFAARILAVSDSFDAMTSDRPYRQSMTESKALEEIKRCSGSQFDPDVVSAFLKLLCPDELAVIP